MNNLFIEQDGKWTGPFNRDMLITFLARGLCTLQTPCRREGRDEIRTVEFFTGGAWGAPAPQSPTPTEWAPPKEEPQVSGLGLLATLLIIGGIGGLVYFVGFFDVSVRVSAVHDGRVNNLGLMQDRQLGMILSALALVLGVALAIFDSVNRRR